MAFVPLLRKVNVMLQAPANLPEDLNASPVSDLNVSKDSSKDLAYVLSCDEFLEKYVPEDLWLPSDIKLEPFYTPERLGKVKVDKGNPIPARILKLTFLHFFYSTCRAFLEQYKQKDVVKGDQIALL